LPVVGDSIHYVDANAFGFDAAGVGSVTAKVWDFSALMATGTTFDFVYIDPTTIPANLGRDSFPTATIARGESDAAGYFYYQNTVNNINRLGWFASNSDYGVYKNGTIATEFHFPITAGQNVNSTYHGNYSPFGVGEDSVRITDGSLTINADMQGQMILPTGTFNGVLRMHVLESFHIKTYSGGMVLLDDVISDDYYYWFTDTILQPLFISGVTTVDGTAQTPVLRYQPISIITGITNNNIEIANIYPNPSNGKFTIKNYDVRLTNYNLEIYNVLGEKIYYSKLKQQTQNGTGRASDEIDLSGSPKGIYFVKIYDGEKIYTEKIVIQ
jgi:hypothetical protein